MITSSTTNKARYRTPMSIILVLTVGTPLLINPLHHYLHVSYRAAPFVILLPWLPFLLWDTSRRWQTTKQEKQALQAKYDAEDIALFGHKPDLT